MPITLYILVTTYVPSIIYITQNTTLTVEHGSGSRVLNIGVIRDQGWFVVAVGQLITAMMHLVIMVNIIFDLMHLLNYTIVYV